MYVTVTQGIECLPPKQVVAGSIPVSNALRILRNTRELLQHVLKQFFSVNHIDFFMENIYAYKEY